MVSSLDSFSSQRLLICACSISNCLHYDYHVVGARFINTRLFVHDKHYACNLHPYAIQDLKHR